MTIAVSTGALTRITRRRQAPGSYIDGVWTPGAVTEAVLLASVQPLTLEDVDLVGGAQFSDRRKIYVGYLEHAVVSSDDLAALRWGGTAEGFAEASEPPLAAAYEDRGADRVLIDGADYVVESSMAWPSHVEAILLREP